MPAERAGYTVTMFLVDVSPSMGNLREVEVPNGTNGDARTVEVTNLEWSLQFVKLKIQEMIYNGRKTDQCGVILFGTEETNNIIARNNEGYEHVSEYIPIGQPNAGTLAKLSALQAGTVAADPIDALIVGIETQAVYLASKKTWTRKIVLLTDGESPIEVEEWERTVAKMNENSTSLTVVGVDFDDDELPFEEENKSHIKRANETFYSEFTEALDLGIKGTCAFAIREVNRPDIKSTKSTLMGNVLRLGDVDTRPEEAIEIIVKTSKCTALSRPKSWKKFSRADEDDGRDDVKIEGDDVKIEEDAKMEGAAAGAQWSQLQLRTEYFIDHNDGVKEEDAVDDEDEGKKEDGLAKVEKEELVRGFKYGSTYAPCPEGQFPKLDTRKGIDICGFFPAKNFHREQAMGEVHYVWADPSAAQEQIALSSVVQAMFEKNVMAIGRWVTRDGVDPKMGVLSPSVFEKVDCLLWVPMPFADDVRKYTFASLDTLVTKSGEILKKHPYLPTDEQLEAMDNFVDAMDLMTAGEKDEEGNRTSWFDTRLSYNPAVHRVKQALFHGAIVDDLATNPLPPPHPELLKYFDPPRRVLKRAREATEDCVGAFKVKEVPKKVAKTRKDGHIRARDEDEDMILLDTFGKPGHTNSSGQSQKASSQRARTTLPKAADETETEDEDEEPLLLDQPLGATSGQDKPRSSRNHPLPTPSSLTSLEGHEHDAGRVPGRIVGATRPLEDFRRNIERGDLVTKAVEDLGFVIQDVITRPFAARRHKEMVECLLALRDTALQEDEIDAWNDLIRKLRGACLAKPGNNAFWTEVQKLGRKGGLISRDEASQYNGKSDISEADAEQFIAQ